MMLPMTESVLAPGVILRAVQTKKFKTSMLSVTFLEPLTADHASLNALLPKVLRRGTQRHPDMESLSAAPMISTAGESVHSPQKGRSAVHRLLGEFLDDAFVPQRPTSWRRPPRCLENWFWRPPEGRRIPAGLCGE